MEIIKSIKSSSKIRFGFWWWRFNLNSSCKDWVMKITDKWLISFTECEFPDEWLGEWNLEGERISLNITKETFGTKGLCLKHDDDMGIYILSQRYCLLLKTNYSWKLWKFSALKNSFWKNKSEIIILFYHLSDFFSMTILLLLIFEKFLAKTNFMILLI